MTRVVLVDDHQLLRQALRRTLEDAGISVVSEASDGREAVALTLAYSPDVVLMDVSMPDIDGIEATRRIIAARPETKVAILTMHDEDALRAEAVRAGAVAFLTKGCAMHEMVDTVRAVADGEVLLSPEIATSMLTVLEGGASPSPLTKREREILQQVADGHSTSEIARELFISIKTVKNHLASIYTKLDAHDRTQAVLSGMRLGIVKLAS